MVNFDTTQGETVGHFILGPVIGAPVADSDSGPSGGGGHNLNGTGGSRANPTSSTSTYTNSGFAYDFAIAGWPFLSAATDRNPITRQFVPVRRQQLDTSKDPGEHSLDSWWVRSQTDWSNGAGQVLYEPADDDTVRAKFYRSQGVDVWKAGEVSLLPAMDELSSADFPAADLYPATDLYPGTGLIETGTNCPIASGRTAAGTEYLIYADGTDTKKWDGTTHTTITGLSAQPSWLWSAGTQIFACHATGIDRIDLTGTTGAAMYTGAAAAPKVWWVKQRLIASVANALHECAYQTTSSVLPAAIYTHPNADWHWTAVVDTPGAILAAGYSGSKGAIYRLVLDSSGTLPTLTSAITTAEFPQGEWPTGMLSYLGAYVAIGTNKGVRIAQVSDTGQLQYGPLTLETGFRVEHFTADDSYIYAGVTQEQLDGTSGVARIDLSNQDPSGRYAYTMGLGTTDTGTVSGVTQFGSSGRICISTDSIWLESATDKVASGWLETSKILFNTQENKKFRNVRVNADVPGGSLAVSTYQGGEETGLTTWTAKPGEQVQITPSAGMESLVLRFRLTRDTTDPTISPVLFGYQVRAVPVLERKQQIQVPLLCYDTERDAFGNISYDNAWDRYNNLVAAVEGGDLVSFQDLNTRNTITGVLEDLQFEQASPPQGFDGFGGVLTISVRAL